MTDRRIAVRYKETGATRSIPLEKFDPAIHDRALIALPVWHYEVTKGGALLCHAPNGSIRTVRSAA